MNSEDLITMLRQQLGPAIEACYAEHALALPDCVLLYGSHAWGTPSEFSDIDIAVLGQSAGSAQADSIYDALEKRTPELPWWRVEIQFADFTDVVRYRKFSQCILSKIWTGGVELWTAPEAVRAEREAALSGAELSAAKAKADWVQSQRLKAFAILVSGRKFKDLPDREYAQNAFTGTCFSLWALLYSAGIDPSPREFRWRPERLLEIGIWIHPDLSRLQPLLLRLPERFCRDSMDAGCVGKEEARSALAAAWRIHRAVKKLLREHRA